MHGYYEGSVKQVTLFMQIPYYHYTITNQSVNFIIKGKSYYGFYCAISDRKHWCGQINIGIRLNTTPLAIYICYFLCTLTTNVMHAAGHHMIEYRGCVRNVLDVQIVKGKFF